MGVGFRRRPPAYGSRHEGSRRGAAWLAVSIAVAVVAAATLGSPPDPFEDVEEASVADIEDMLRLMHSLQMSYHAENGRYALGTALAGLSFGDHHPGVMLDVVHADEDDYCVEANAVTGGHPYRISARDPTPVRASC